MDARATLEHKIELAGELLDDIELERLTAEKLLLKTGRLARLVGNQEIVQWLRYEMVGFNYQDNTSLKYMDLTWRWIDKPKKIGYWWGLPQIEAKMIASQAELKQLQMPNVNFSPSSSNPSEMVTGPFGGYLTQATQPIRDILNRMESLNSTIVNLSGIKARVLSLLHTFISNSFYELKFSGMQETIFEKQKSAIDSLISTRCGEVLQKIPSIYDRLSAKDPEAISQALNSCRRIIDTFADNVFPPQEGTYKIGGNDLKLTAQHHKNRINVFIHQNCESGSLPGSFDSGAIVDETLNPKHEALNNIKIQMTKGPTTLGILIYALC